MNLHGLDTDTQSNLRAHVLYELRITPASFWRWTKGLYPTLYPVRVAAASVVNKFLGTDYAAADLFPSPKN